jgi:hypothetical protein
MKKIDNLLLNKKTGTGLFSAKSGRSILARNLSYIGGASKSTELQESVDYYSNDDGESLYVLTIKGEVTSQGIYFKTLKEEVAFLDQLSHIEVLSRVDEMVRIIKEPAKKPTASDRAKALGLTRDGYEKRLKSWTLVLRDENGEEYLVNPKQCMKKNPNN